MGKSRLDEHEAFLKWLLQTIEQESIDTLIVAGDIFDTATPPNYALEIYYNFLTKISSICKNIIITAGNHDSVATLKAPKQLLRALNVHVITSGDEDEDEVIALYDDKELQGIVCAVPFLRDFVVRRSQSAQTMSDKESALSLGIKEHYKSVYEKAKEISKDVPIIATGHLTTLGSKTSESEREIYIGGTLDLDSQFFKDFDYVALGHLHINQRVGSERVRYSGSPIPLSFSESNSQKKVNIVEFVSGEVEVTELDIPLFRKLLVIRGDTRSVIKELESITNKETWIEIHIKDENPFHANESIRTRAKELDLTLLAVKIDKEQTLFTANTFNAISLDELNPLEVFKQRVELEALEDEELAKDLLVKFKEIVSEVEDR